MNKLNDIILKDWDRTLSFLRNNIIVTFWSYYFVNMPQALSTYPTLRIPWYLKDRHRGRSETVSWPRNTSNKFYYSASLPWKPFQNWTNRNTSNFWSSKRNSLCVCAEPDVYFHLPSQSGSVWIQEAHVHTEASRISWNKHKWSRGFGK